MRLVSGNIVEVNFSGDWRSSAASADVPFGSGWTRFTRQDVNLGTFLPVDAEEYFHFSTFL